MEKERATQKTVLGEILEWVLVIAIAVVIAFFARRYVFSLVIVDGPSMQPTLQTDERLYVNRFMYEPQLGDIIVFHPHNDPKMRYIKRVIALAGQKVDIDYATSTVYVDDMALDEPYLEEQQLRIHGDVEFPVVVPENSVFVMGDNRNNSRDSRSSDVGFVDKISIVGEALFRFYPFDKFGAI